MAAPAGRPARTTETRQADTRAQDRRVMPMSRHVGKLYIPPEEIPEGMVYSYVDVGLDKPNFQRADEQAAKGWTPVPRSRHPKFGRGSSLIPGRELTDPYAQFINIGGLLLCERPKDDVDQEKEMLAMKSSAAVNSISQWRGGEGADPLLPRVDKDARLGFDNAPAEFSHGATFKKD